MEKEKEGKKKERLRKETGGEDNKNEIEWD